jgi:hypothetical protein
MKGKKSFVLYADLLHTVELLADVQAGMLLKHILRYVNDQNPEPPDPLVQLVFEPVRQNLKRDLQKWTDTRVKRSEAGKLGAAVKKQNKQLLTNASKSKQSEAVNVNVNVNVTDSVIELIEHFNKCFNKSTKVIPKTARAGYNDLIKDGYTLEDIKNAMLNASKDKWHVEKKYEVCTYSYFCKPDVIDRYHSVSAARTKTNYIPTK